MSTSVSLDLELAIENMLIATETADKVKWEMNKKQKYLLLNLSRTCRKRGML